MFVERFVVGLFAFFVVVLLDLSFYLLFNIIGSSPARFFSKKSHFPRELLASSKGQPYSAYVGGRR